MSERQDLSIFGLDENGCGIEFAEFTSALGVFISLRGEISVALAAETFNVTDNVVRKAVAEHYWLFLLGEDDDPTKQMIDIDGE